MDSRSRQGALVLGLFLGLACAPDAGTQVATLVARPISSLEGVLTRTGVVFDAEQSSDGNGSLRIDAGEPTTVRLFETGDLDVEDAVVTYTARLRTEDVKGRVFLEMWAVMPGRGEFFSRALAQPLSGSVGWTSQQTPFVLQPGQNPENLRLNVVIEGTGTVWVDDVRVTAAG